jgi:hypothetical protein
MPQHIGMGLMFALLFIVACDRYESPKTAPTSQNRQIQSDADAAVKSNTIDRCKASLYEFVEDQEQDEVDTSAWNAVEPFQLAAVAESVTYDGEISKLLARACVNCHKPGGDRPDLSTFALAKQNGPSSLSSIQRNRMPTRTPLVQADKDLYQAWADAGFLQNVPTPPSVPSPSPPSEKPVDEAPEIVVPAPLTPPDSAASEAKIQRNSSKKINRNMECK